MADIDSGAARNRQAPRPPTPVAVATRVPRQPRSTVKVGSSAKRRSSGGSRRTSSGSSNRNDYRQQSYQRRASSSHSSSSGSTRKKTPSPPPLPTKKVIVPPAPPKPPSIATSLRSDTTYQQQMAAYAKSLADFQAEQGLSRADYDKNYQGTSRDIGLAKGQALQDMENDYASRGLLRSSLYNTDVGKLNQQYQNQYNDLNSQRTNFLQQLAQQLGSYQNEQKVQQQNAMQEALRRRAEKYNL